MSEENAEDRAKRRRGHLSLVFFLAYSALVVYLLMNPVTRIIGVFNVIVVGFMLSHYFLKFVMEHPQHWWRLLVYSGWHGKYRAFQGHRVRVIDGERYTPSRVFAADIFEILGQKPSLTDLELLQTRYATGFEKGTEDPAEDEWLFTDEACVGYVQRHMDEQRTQRGRDAMKLATWLEREVFMPIDNRRSAATGKTYAFTKEMVHRP
ncbi:MAG: hypothetical protein JO292_03735 [Betaproteobacteria bacterium]|nr:hypothetical protein [Betaproteobacteria bacterium]MBV9360482.1 hypothetical protein [Betaproteobacteria bacterium]